MTAVVLAVVAVALLVAVLAALWPARGAISLAGRIGATAPEPEPGVGRRRLPEAVRAARERLAVRRREQFRQVLPDALALLAGTLSAGHALAPAIALVARDCPEPVAEEWGRAVAQAQRGHDLLDALESAGARMRSAEMGWVVLVLRVQREVGGSLAAVLTTVAGSMRDRERHRRRVRALTAEARLSAVILAALPVVFAGYLALVRPEYIGLLVTTPLGLGLAAVAVALLALGVLWMRLLSGAVT